MAVLDRWDSFYLIVRSTASALIGLRCVVITLIARRPPKMELDFRYLDQYSPISSGRKAG